MEVMMAMNTGAIGHKINTLPETLEYERILTAKQAAELFGISLSTFRRQYWAGVLPAPVHLSTRRIGWRVRDLIVHLSSNSGS